MNKIKSVKVGGVNYPIEYIKDLRDDGGKLDGRIHHGATLMQIENEMSEQGCAQAMMHEILHAATVQIGRQDISGDENLIDGLAFSIFQIIRDNPKFINWILGM